MRRRNGYGRTSLKEFSSSHLIESVNTILLNRKAQLAPFPYTGKEIYDAMWTSEEKQVIGYLQTHIPGILKYDDDFVIYLNKAKQVFTTPGGYKYSQLRIEVGCNVPLPSNDWRMPTATPHRHLGQLPKEMQESITEWLNVFGRLNGETTETVNACREVFSSCNTFGQIVRLWPSLKSFLPEEAMVKIRDQKILSKLPDDVFVRELLPDNKVLRPEFSPDRFAKLDSVIAEALILPCDMKAGTTPDWIATPN